MRRGALLASAFLAAGLAVAACGGSEGRAASSTDPAPGRSTNVGEAGSGGPSHRQRVLRVVTTTTQLTDFARVVGGDDVAVYPVLKANVDPHDYEPTPADLDAIARADVIVKNGVGLERWFDDTIRSASPKGAIVDASTGVRLRRGDGDEDRGEGDPHIWHNPQDAKIMVANVADALAVADPTAAADFRQRQAAYDEQLDRLDADIRAQLATLTNRALVTNHDAFGYYVDHFGLDFVGSVIPSFDTQAELSPKDIHDLVATIKAQRVKAIFSESSLPPKTAAAIADEAGVKVVEGPDALFGDSLGPPGSDGDTYLKMEAHNTRVIVENLR